MRVLKETSNIIPPPNSSENARVVVRKRAKERAAEKQLLAALASENAAFKAALLAARRERTLALDRAGAVYAVVEQERTARRREAAAHAAALKAAATDLAEARCAAERASSVEALCFEARLARAAADAAAAARREFARVFADRDAESAAVRDEAEACLEALADAHTAEMVALRRDHEGAMAGLAERLRDTFDKLHAAQNADAARQDRDLFFARGGLTDAESESSAAREAQARRLADNANDVARSQGAAAQAAVVAEKDAQIARLASHAEALAASVEDQRLTARLATEAHRAVARAHQAQLADLAAECKALAEEVAALERAKLAADHGQIILKQTILDLVPGGGPALVAVHRHQPRDAADVLGRHLGMTKRERKALLARVAASVPPSDDSAAEASQGDGGAAATKMRTTGPKTWRPFRGTFALLLRAVPRLRARLSATVGL